MNFEIRNGHDYIDEVKDLFVEYVKSLGVSASLKEFHGLEDKYKGEGEALYIAFINNQPAGCVALRRVDKNTAAMKRLYVRPAFRHSSLGTNMAKMIVEDAREFGYKTLLLDSLPSMENAKELYTTLGFKKIDGTKEAVKTVVHLSLPL